MARPSEYAKANDWIVELFARLEKLGSSPILVAVPGNHDLARPSATSLEARALLNWTHDQELRASFWEEKDGEAPRAFVSALFEEYTGWLGRWRASRPAPAWATFSGPGLIAGDFSAFDSSAAASRSASWG